MVTHESGSKLREEREAAGISREALARAMGMTMKTVERWEKLDAVHPNNARAYRQALARAVDGLDKPVPRGTLDVQTPPTAEERDYIKGRVNQAGHWLRHRRARGASDEEIATLRRDLAMWIENGLIAGTRDPELRAWLVEQFVETFDRPPMRAGVIPRSDEQRGTGER